MSFNNRKYKQKKFRKKRFKPLEIIKHYTQSEELTAEEQEIINSMTNVVWKPRNKYSHFTFSRIPEDWESLGFISRHHYQGWLNFSRLDNISFNGNELGLTFEHSTGE